MAAVPPAERVNSSPPSSSSVSHSGAVTGSPPIPSRPRRESSTKTAVPAFNLSAAQQLLHTPPSLSSSLSLPASAVAAPAVSLPSVAGIERKDDISPTIPSSLRSCQSSAPVSLSFNSSTAAAASTPSSSSSSSSASVSVSQPRHPRASSTHFSISRYISKFFRPLEPEPSQQAAAGGGLPFASVLSPRSAATPFATLLRHHRQWSAFLFSLHSETVSFSHHMTAAHTDLAALGRSLYSMYRLKEREEQQRRRTEQQHHQEPAADQSSAPHAGLPPVTVASALTSSLHHVFPISESFSSHTSQASHLYETLMQQRFDQLILPWLTERLRDSERMDGMIVEDRTRWQRYEHYSTKLSGLETMLESARKEGREVSVSERERYERNVEKLASSRGEYEQQHGRLVHELSCSFEMRFSFLDGLLIELVKAEQAYHAAMHTQLLPIILRIREMMREGRKDKPPPLPAQPPPAPPDLDAENTVLFASSHPTLSQAGFRSLSLSQSSSSSSLHSHYSILSKIGAGTYGETLCCTDDEEEGVWVMKRIHCRTVREVNRGMREAMMMSAVRTCDFICKVREVFVEEGHGDEEKVKTETKEAEPQQDWQADSARYEGETETAGEGQRQQQQVDEQPLSGSVFTVCIVMEYCFDPSVCVWLADGSSKRVDQLLPTDQLLDELGEAISIVPNTLIGTVHFPQPLPAQHGQHAQPGHAANSVLLTPAQPGYVPAPGTTTVNPGYQNKRRIAGVISGFTPFIVSDNHPLTVGSSREAHAGATNAKVRRAQAYHFPADCNWQVGQAPAPLVGQPIWGYTPTTCQRGGWCNIRPYYWQGGLDLTGLPYPMGGAPNGDYRDPRAGPLPPGGWQNKAAALAAQINDWNTIHQLPAEYRLGEYPVHVIEAMPPSVKGGLMPNGQWDGQLALVKLSRPVVFPVNNYVAQKLDLAMQDAGLPTGQVDGVNYAQPQQACPRVFFRAAQLERALRLTAAAQPGVYAFHDAAAVADRGVLDEQNYRDASQAIRAAILAAQANPLLAAPANPYQMIPYANPNPYQAIFPPTSTDLQAFPTLAARVQALVDYMVEVTAWVAGIWLTDGDSSGLFITQSLLTEFGLAHVIPNDHSGVFERCRHWVGLLGLADSNYSLSPAGLGHGANQLPSSSIYFHRLQQGVQIGQANILRALLLRCGAVVLPIFPPGLTQAQRDTIESAAEQLNKPRFWDAALPNRLGWQNETVRTRRAFLAGLIDGDGTREAVKDQWSISQEIAKAEGVAWWASLFRQLGFSTGQPASDPSGTRLLLQNIMHHFTDQLLLPIAILHKRTVGAGRRPDSPHTATFRILHDDDQNVPLAKGPVVSFTVQKPGRPCSHRLLLADGTITHNCEGGDLQRRINIEASKRRQLAFAAAAAALPSSSSSSSITVSVPSSADVASPTAAGSFSSPSNSGTSYSDDDAASLSSASFTSSSSSSTAGFTASRIVSWMCQLCSGLQSLHSALLIHRDIKPDNLFLTSDDSLRIGDCGIMHQLHSASAVTSTAIGTPAYMAPEVVGKRAYGLPADVWSAGCVLYELCTLSSPSFSFRSVDTVLGQVRDRGYAEGIVSLLGRMLSVDAKLRPTAAECVALLRAITESNV